jgi:uncharacterized membrane protein YfcA
MYESLLPVLGFLVGLVVGMTGIGAGAIMTPLLLAIGFPPVSAVGTDLLHSSFSKAFGVLLYFKRGAVNLKIVAHLIFGSLVALAAGGYLIVAIRAVYGEATLSLFIGLCIAIILPIAGIRYLLGGRTQSAHKGDADPAPSIPSLSSVGFLIGLAVNLTSIGAGSMLMPYLMRIMKSAREMVGTDLAYGFLVSLFAGLLQISLGNVLLVPLLYLLLGSLPGTYLGVKLNERVRVEHMRVILSVLIIGSGLAILARFLTSVWPSG